MRRWTLIELRKLEQAFPGESFIRELEMVVGDCVPDPGARIQFWADVELYGADEAVLYVKNGKRGRWMSIQAKLNEIKAHTMDGHSFQGGSMRQATVDVVERLTDPGYPWVPATAFNAEQMAVIDVLYWAGVIRANDGGSLSYQWIAR
jgi:hypothetical protein